MKLLPRYATALGLKIGRQWLLESFYPLPTTRYITLHASSGMAAKNYPHYQEVVALIAHILNAQGIQIVQLGAKEDPAINGCVHLQGKTDFHQSSYILRGSLLHIGNDSWLAHRAGEQGVPLITLFGPTSAANHGAYAHDPAKTVFIESHRWGHNPTFAAQESPSSIALIAPETVANAALRLLGIADTIPQKTCYIGPLYQHAILELIPNVCPAAGFCPELPVTVRMDILFNEAVLVQLLQTGRKVHIITKGEINANLLAQAKAQVLSYSHEIVEGAEPTVPYTDAIRALFPASHAFYTRATDEAAIAAVRFRYFDHVIVNTQRDSTKAEVIDAALVFLNRPLTPENRLDMETQLIHSGRIKTNKYVLSDSRVFLSHAHVSANQSIDSLANNTAAVIDDPALWRDAQHQLLLTHV